MNRRFKVYAVDYECSRTLVVATSMAEALEKWTAHRRIDNPGFDSSPTRCKRVNGSSVIGVEATSDSLDATCLGEPVA